MKKLSLVFGIVLAVLVGIVGYRQFDKNQLSAAKVAATDHATPREHLEKGSGSFDELSVGRAASHKTTRSESENEAINKLRRELEAAKVQLEKISRPLEQDFLSSTINAEIASSKTLATGGYMTDGGNYEMTLLTPHSITLEDGSEAIQMDCRVISVASESVKSQGLETLATNARNTLQHGESWMPNDVARTVAAEGVRTICSPKIVTEPSINFRGLHRRQGRCPVQAGGECDKKSKWELRSPITNRKNSQGRTIE